jgi:hypothetical protein
MTCLKIFKDQPINDGTNGSMKKSVLLLIFTLALAIAACSENQAETNEEPQLGRGPQDLCSIITEIPASECDALVSFYNSTGGPNWMFKRGWLETKQPCDWYGVKCGAGRVTAITMNYNELRGSLPSEMGNLAKLQTLSLYFNHLSEPLPPELGNLSDLEMLILHSNKLSGHIPPELGNLSSLRKLDLESNSLSGRIPPELGNLTNLETLNLNNNELSGSIPPDLGNLSNLQGLFLAGNNLSGRIPSELGNLTNLGMVNVDYNNLSGDLPGNLQNLPRSGYDFLKQDKDQPSDEATD